MFAEYIADATWRDWVMCLIIFLLLLWKIWPDVSNRIKSAFNTARYGADLVDKVESHELALNGPNGIQDKLQRDFNRINKLEANERVNSEENALVMKSMLVVIKVMNKVEPSEEADQIQGEIIEFMNKQSHKV